MTRLSGLLQLAEDVWRKARASLVPALDKHQHQQQQTPAAGDHKMPPSDNQAGPTKPRNGGDLPASATAGSTPTTNTTTTTMAPSMTNDATSASKKRYWQRRSVHFTVFLAVFSTILSLLWTYTLYAEIRRNAFMNSLKKVQTIGNVSMDNPELVNFIRTVGLKSTTRQDPLNSTQTPEEQFIESQLLKKRRGVYFEYMSRAGASSTTAWLETELGWNGLSVFTDSRSYFDALRSSRDPKSRVLQACLSTDEEIKEITYHQETDVQVTKLGEGPNSLGLIKDSLPASRLKCFPLYSILLAYNSTTLDYLSLDSTEVQDGLVLDTIPWDSIRISILSIHWGTHHTDAETKTFVDKLLTHNYVLARNLPTSKLVFLYNRGLKIQKQ
ncbi:hypothetical protein QAD02_022019 [Eretmocerus hayati]|uniref:Uncharacterized protein n=1 Tax=Eretmocerus hayati TaxID=131215 RepID=A0ACC2PS43_9HYME|nr:hypothetical protein QAD02_022019 [Eretmocerus hayati]